MLNRIACAALFSVLSLLGSGNTPVDPADTDPDDDTVECVVPDRQPGPVGGRLTPGEQSDPPDIAWVLRRPGEAAAAAARCLPNDVVVLDLAAGGGEAAGDAALRLLDQAMSFAHQRGAVKVIVRADRVPAAALWSKMSAHGCQFAGVRLPTGYGPTVEFYTDIYRTCPRAHRRDRLSTAELESGSSTPPASVAGAPVPCNV